MLSSPRPLVVLWCLTVMGAAGAQQVPREQLTWGFCTVAGTSAHAEWPLSREELVMLRDELHINAVRLFVHPAFIGLPQKSWNGPESLDYTHATDADYLWRDPSPAIDSLDEVLDLLRELGIHPVLMVWPVEEYIHYLCRDDLTFLNDPAKGLDYTGIRPVDQVKALTVAMARHVHETYDDDFTLIYTEIAGQGDGAPKRIGEKDRWAEIVAAAKAEAPGAVVCSPEVCIGMWWWAAAGARAAGSPAVDGPLPFDIPYSDDWPRGDRLENYRDVFDEIAISYYGSGPESIEWKDVATDRPALSAATEGPLFVARPHFRPKRWLWAEAGWGAPLKERPPLHLERDLAALLFGLDGSAGALLWQAKDNEGSAGGVFSDKGVRTASFPLLKAVADVVLADAAFFATDHPRLNADGFPVAEDVLREADPAVLTRFVGNHLLLFSEAPTMTEVTLTDTAGVALTEVPVGHGYSTPWPLDVRPNPDGTITIGRIRPGLLYIMRAAGK